MTVHTTSHRFQDLIPSTPGTTLWPSVLQTLILPRKIGNGVQTEIYFLLPSAEKLPFPIALQMEALPGDLFTAAA